MMEEMVTLRIIIGVLITLCFKKTSLISCSSYCYSIYPHEATDVKEGMFYHVIYLRLQTGRHELRLPSKHGLKIILIFVPRSSNEMWQLPQNHSKNQMHSKCDTCKKVCHSKCIIDKLNDATESIFVIRVTLNQSWVSVMAIRTIMITIL